MHTLPPRNSHTVSLQYFNWVLTAVEASKTEKTTESNTYRTQNIILQNEITVNRMGWAKLKFHRSNNYTAAVVLGQVASLTQGKKPHHIKIPIFRDKNCGEGKP